MTPGFRNPRFYIVAVLTLLSALAGSGAVPSGGALEGGLGFILSALLATGYASVRAFAKGVDGKPAWRSSEFWLSLAAAVVCLVQASGAWSENDKFVGALGFIATALAAAGYGARFQLPPK